MTTGRQEQILLYIRSRSRAHEGRGPSLRDILEYFEPTGDEGRLEISREIKELESDGLIRKDETKLRNWIDYENIYFIPVMENGNPSDHTRSSAMATDFTGTNSERIDKLIVTIIELRTTLRICFAIIGIGFPMMVGLLTFLVVQSFGTAAKIDRLTDQIAVVRMDYGRLSERLDRLERPGPP